MRYQDYYKTLGVERSADADAIRAAYRKLARQHHPDVDKSPGADARFKEINEAYEVLKDAEKRARYDALGANWQSGEEFAHPRGGGGPQYDFEGFGDSGFSSFFESLFGNAGTRFEFGGARTGRAGRPRGGTSLESEITLSLEDVVRGGKHEVVIAGGGLGERTLSITLPPGTTEGTSIRLAGQGEPGRNGGDAGDLILHVRIAPHPRWRVDGHDLATRVALTPSEAALGARVPVALVDGEATVSVPAGSQSGAVLRLRGQGLPRRDGSRGDVLVELAIAVPATLTARERELYEALAKESRFDPRR